MRRTFVVKLRADATPAELAGRLENLVTGRQHTFASADELIAAIAGELVLYDPDRIPTIR
jgi:hypothetical protein